MSDMRVWNALPLTAYYDQIDATATVDEVHEKAKLVVARVFAGEVGNITA